MSIIQLLDNDLTMRAVSEMDAKNRRCTMSCLNVETVIRIMAETIIAHENELSELDGVVGDGDFGFSLARGFEKVLEDFDQLDRS